MNYYYNFVDDVKTAKFKLLLLRVLGFMGFLFSVILFIKKFDPDYDDFFGFLYYLFLAIVFTYLTPAIAVGWWKLGGLSLGNMPVIVDWFIGLMLKIFLAWVVGLVFLVPEWVKLGKAVRGESLIVWIKELLTNWRRSRKGSNEVYHNGRFKEK